MKPETETLRQRIEALAPWFHNLSLDGIRTAPDHFLHDYPAHKWAGFADAIPADLQGASVLDIGCNAGFYSVEMKRRGAGRVVAVDHDPRYLAQAQLVAEVTGVELELRQMDVYEVGALRERFDVVLLLGVLYHLRHPLLALDLVHEHVARDLFVVQSLQRGTSEQLTPDADYPFEEKAIFEQRAWPKLSFVERRYAGDPTNWWIPNASAMAAMLRSAGFRIESHPEAEVYVCRREELGPLERRFNALPTALATDGGVVEP